VTKALKQGLNPLTGEALRKGDFLINGKNTDLSTEHQELQVRSVLLKAAIKRAQ
jgi:hypothetical protein